MAIQLAFPGFGVRDQETSETPVTELNTGEWEQEIQGHGLHQESAVSFEPIANASVTESDLLVNSQQLATGYAEEVVV